MVFPRRGLVGAVVVEEGWWVGKEKNRLEESLVGKKQEQRADFGKTVGIVGWDGNRPLRNMGIVEPKYRIDGLIASA